MHIIKHVQKVHFCGINKNAAILMDDVTHVSLASATCCYIIKCIHNVIGWTFLGLKCAWSPDISPSSYSSACWSSVLWSYVYQVVTWSLASTSEPNKDSEVLSSEAWEGITFSIQNLVVLLQS